MTGHLPYDASPHPTIKQTFTLTIDGTGGTYKLRNTYHTGPKNTVTTSDTAALGATDAAGVVQAALEAVLGVDGVTVTGGPGDAGGTTPYTIVISEAQIELSVTEETLTGGAGTATLVELRHGVQRPFNVTISDPGAAGRPDTAAARPRNDRQYGQTAYSPDPSAIETAVSTAAAANALTTTASGIHGHTKSDGDVSTGFKNP